MKTLRQEQILLEARISKLRAERKKLDHKADAYIRMIREIVDPYGGDYTTWDFARSTTLNDELADTAKAAREIDEHIAKLERELNG